MEVRQAMAATLTVVEMEDGSMSAAVAVDAYPGGPTQIWSSGDYSDSSSLFLALVEQMDRLCFTFLATTLDGTVPPLAERVC